MADELAREILRNLPGLPHLGIPAEYAASKKRCQFLALRRKSMIKGQDAGTPEWINLVLTYRPKPDHGADEGFTTSEPGKDLIAVSAEQRS